MPGGTSSPAISLDHNGRKHFSESNCDTMLKQIQSMEHLFKDSERTETWWTQVFKTSRAGLLVTNFEKQNLNFITAKLNDGFKTPLQNQNFMATRFKIKKKYKNHE